MKESNSRLQALEARRLKHFQESMELMLLRLSSEPCPGSPRFKRSNARTASRPDRAFCSLCGGRYRIKWDDELTAKWTRSHKSKK